MKGHPLGTVRRKPRLAETLCQCLNSLILLGFSSSCAATHRRVKKPTLTSKYGERTRRRIIHSRQAWSDDGHETAEARVLLSSVVPCLGRQGFVPRAD